MAAAGGFGLAVAQQVLLTMAQPSLCPVVVVVVVTVAVAAVVQAQILDFGTTYLVIFAKNRTFNNLGHGNEQVSVDAVFYA